MIKIGLVSVSHRSLDPPETIRRVLAAGLEGIEWNGNTHVPHGDLSTARSVRRLCDNAGIQIAAYGSYYRPGWQHSSNPDPIAVIETAFQLGAPLIRVWAGRKASKDCSVADRNAIGAALKSFCDSAGDANLTVALEYHPNTLADTPESTVALITAVDSPNLRTLWQPTVGETLQHNLDSLITLTPYLANLHAFAIEPGVPGPNTVPLATHLHRWRHYLSVVPKSQLTRWVLLEVGGHPDYTTQLMKDDAAAIKMSIHLCDSSKK